MDKTEAENTSTSSPDALPQRERKKRTRVGDAAAGDDNTSDVADSARATAATGEESSISKFTPSQAPGESLDVESDRDSDEAYLENTRDEANRAFDRNVTVENRSYEYLDHTADVQLHSWGRNLKEAMSQLIVSMFGYMTNIDDVGIDEDSSFIAETEGHDLLSLTYNILDELLYIFSTTDRVVVDCNVLELQDPEASGSANWKIRVACKGERFDLSKHSQGAEIKAITYSNMQIHGWDDPKSERVDIYVIVDI
eukprot:gb/GECG01007306.1/.p1 GENE.gb/GECG01007306.1/~~gb/GECG01007306.1/.p1  ORF type:complete len:254 (+),score=45.86 gb/GECG01007306.1/:1-762(+)